MPNPANTLNLIQHHPAEGPGAITDWARRRGVALKVFRADLGQLPTVSSEPAIVLGGPYEANAGPAWLETERQWLAASVQQGAPVFAICLGAQLLALSLGGKVRRMAHPETGWTSVIFADGTLLSVLEWHEDAIDLPPAAQLLASSEGCEQQMYRVSPHRVGVQFHPEWNAESVTLLNQHFADESPLLRDQDDSAAHAAVFDWLRGTLDEWWTVSTETA
ncbi:MULTISPECIES: type 1 glutamine amidotransferase [unclassified Pseudomonas]|uniref:type 1 glutamine amidotransferase n=1 Tax=unclassified Pseudomonas TaxID=196821 RepID=UPI002AC9AA8E|nr:MULTISPECIES: type 1 glutamine amidotransferase [unclassified Pseudomonas]MEB0045891.1 type 1 glutamine amidotransferase [Pseudomonas sp. Dout3]MEB0097151.1 type 1 glutamine amidotransferase [Pseudomonas sp. DC1.2]WPX56912.1 type 1 glutamine amidotransferase [Pseudomonas sp. DC1.2]